MSFKNPMIVNNERIHTLVKACLMLGEYGFTKVYSASLGQEVYLVLTDNDKQLVTENDLTWKTYEKLIKKGSNHGS